MAQNQLCVLIVIKMLENKQSDWGKFMAGRKNLCNQFDHPCDQICSSTNNTFRLSVFAVGNVPSIEFGRDVKRHWWGQSNKYKIYTTFPQNVAQNL